MKSKICFCLIFLFPYTFRVPEPAPAPAARFQNQGIAGYVYRVAGNRMPSPNRKPALPQGVKTTLFIYHLTNLNQVLRRGNSPFYSSILTKKVETVESDTTGHFQLWLPPGRYSIFTKKDSLFFANRYDGQNNISPFTVESAKTTRVEILIDYEAYY